MLFDVLKSMDKSGLFQSNDLFVNFSTGLLPLDYANGFWMTQEDEAGNLKKVAVPGILGGKLILLFGTTGSGKTTLAEQIAYSIIKPFDDGMEMLVDCEQTALKERMCQITGMSQDDPRCILNVDHTSVEEVLDIINMVCQAKEELGDKAKFTPAIGDYHGKPFRAYVPTVIIIDSLRQFNSKQKDVLTLGNNMDNAREALVIARFLDNVINRINQYNITIIYTNHIQPKIATNMYQEPPRGLMLEPTTETLPRGTRPLFLAHTAIRANAIKSNMYTNEDVGFEGFMVTLLLAKSKTNYIGATLNVAFTAEKGFDPIFTLYEFANQCGLIQGRNPYLFITGMEDFKFKRKDFRTKMRDDREFNRRFMKTIYPYLEALLGSKEMTEDDRIKYGDYTEIPGDDECEMIDAVESVDDAAKSNVLDAVRIQRKKRK